MMLDKAKTKAFLVQAKGLISKGWIQGYYARDALGCDVDTSDPNAVAFCVRGAFFALEERGVENWLEAEIAFNNVIGHNVPIAQWNDAPERTQAEVLKAFDVAIASL